MALPGIRFYRVVPDGGFSRRYCHYKTGNARDHADCTWEGHRIRAESQPRAIAPFRAHGPVLNSIRRLTPALQAEHRDLLHEMGEAVVLPVTRKASPIAVAKKHIGQLKALLKPLTYEERLQQLYLLKDIAFMESDIMVKWGEPRQFLGLNTYSNALDTLIDRTLNSIRKEAIIKQRAKNISLKQGLKKWGKWTLSKLNECYCYIDEAISSPNAKYRSLFRQAQRTKIPQPILNRFDKELYLFHSTPQRVALVCKAWKRFKSSREGSSRNIDNFISLIQQQHFTEQELTTQCQQPKKEAKKQAYKLLRGAGLHK